MAKKYGKSTEIDQLELSLSIPPVADYETPDRIYQYPELLKHTYFLNSGSKAVSQSRKVYSQSVRTKRQRGEEDASMKKNDLIKTYDNGWSIVGSIEYGLPNELDGHVWDFFKKKISQTRLQEGKFYHLCFFSIEEIIQDLIKTGVLSSRGGKQTQTVNDCISRLFRTAYKYEKGLIVRAEKGKGGQHKEMLHSAEFTLITGVYRKGQVLPNGELCDTQMAIAVNPLIIKSLEQDHYIITNNSRREKLTRYPSKVLYDTLGYWGFIKYKKGEILSLNALSVPPYQVLTYETVCQMLGIEPLPKQTYRESRIKIQLEKIHQELLDAGVIDWYMLEQYRKEGGKGFKIIYAYSRAFMEEIIAFESERVKLEYRQSMQEYQLSLEDTNSVIRKINGQVKSQDVRDKLLRHLFNFPLKTDKK
jgi:hypothetical protein